MSSRRCAPSFAQGRPVGWCAIAPRESYPVPERSRILERVDEAPVRSVVCFFVRREFRGKGVMTALLRAVVDYATPQGAGVIEGYPVEPKNLRTPAVFAWTGLASAFRQAGFVEVMRRSATRPIMRYVIGGSDG
jgi:GNAT superfamily N-acetyltransferase